MSVPSHVSSLWDAYCNSVGGIDASRFYEAFYFGDDQELADSLARLVLLGVKRATATSVWSLEVAGKRPPAVGDLSVVTDWARRPLCIIETVAVDVVPFSQVTAGFAAMEGEGDGSLAYWQDAHRQYFVRECARAGRRFTEDMPVVCEQFKVVHRDGASPPMTSSS